VENRFYPTLEEYRASIQVGIENPPFYAVMEAAKADAGQKARQLAQAFPDGSYHLAAYDRQQAAALTVRGLAFGTLLAHLCRAADTANTGKLQATFPYFWQTMKARYQAPGGILPDIDGFTVEQYMAEREHWQCDECGELYWEQLDACPFCGCTDRTEAE